MLPEQHHNENLLLQLSAKGDEKAFSELYFLYSGRVFSIALKMLKSNSAAEDIMQEVFLKIWLQNEKLSAVTSFKAYLYTITRNHIYNALRKQANEMLLLSKLDIPVIEQEDQVEQFHKKQVRSQLQSSIAKLPAQQRKVLELGKVHGMKHEEIARHLLISNETVKKHMMAAVRAVKNFFF